MPPPADTTRLPRLPDYELLKLIGSGSYGDVWLARGVTGVFRAVKVVWRERFADIRPYAREFEGVTRFASISLREPSQLALLHAGRNDDAGFFYYVMELADDAQHGRAIEPDRYVPLTLKELRVRRGRLPLAEVIGLGVALARALASLHAAGLVHRDIKPSNIVFVGGVPKLADVGLVAAASAALTFVGTEGFVPPEGPGAPAADVFGLGKVLYELATGLDRHDWPRLPPDLAEWSERRSLLELNEVLVRACEPNAQKRFTDAGALLDELLLLQAGKSVRRLRAAERRTARALRIAAMLAAIAAVAGIGAWIEHRRAAEAESERDALARRTIYAARLAQAQRALEQGSFGRARQLLTSVEPKAGEIDLRRFEWGALRREAEGDPHEMLRETGPAIDKLALSPDGKILAVHDRSQTVALLDPVTHREIRRIAGMDRLGGFSSDGNWLVGTTQGLALQRWRVADGITVTAPRAGAAFRPLGAQGRDRMVALKQETANGNELCYVVVWDFATQREEIRLSLSDVNEGLPWKLFRSAALSPDGTEVVITCVKGSGSSVSFRLTYGNLSNAPYLVHELAPVRPGAVGYLPHAENINRWWAADELLGLVVEFDREQKRWRTPDDAIPASPGLLQTALGAELFAIEGTQVKVRFAAGATRTLRGHAGAITSFASSANHTHLFTGSATGELRAWPRNSWTTDRTHRPCWNSGSTATGAVFSTDSQRLLVPDDGQEVTILDVVTLERTGRIPGMHHPFVATPDGAWGLSADKQALVRWSERENRLVQEIGRSAAPIAHAGFSADRRHVVFARSNGDVCAGTTDDGVIARIPNPGEGLRCLMLDPAGQLLWSSGNDRRVTCRTLPDGVIRWAVPISALVADMCWINDPTLMAIALDNGETRLLDAKTGKLLRIVTASTSATQAVAAVPGTNRLLVAGTEGDLHAFDTDTWDYVGLISLHTATSPHVLSVAPDHKSAAVLTKSGMLHLVRTE